MPISLTILRSQRSILAVARSFDRHSGSQSRDASARTSFSERNPFELRRGAERAGTGAGHRRILRFNLCAAQLRALLVLAGYEGRDVTRLKQRILLVPILRRLPFNRADRQRRAPEVSRTPLLALLGRAPLPPPPEFVVWYSLRSVSFVTRHFSPLKRPLTSHFRRRAFAVYLPSSSSSSLALSPISPVLLSHGIRSGRIGLKRVRRGLKIRLAREKLPRWAGGKRGGGRAERRRRERRDVIEMTKARVYARDARAPRRGRVSSGA